MIAYKPLNGYDVLAIPAGWDCFQFNGWLYRRKPGAEGLSSSAFYREKWIGPS